MSDKNVVKTSNLRFDPPNSAGALYQFLSRYSNEASVKLEGAYTAPVIKVRDSEPKKLDSQSRDAWSFYLLNMQQAMAGTERAQTARDVIMSLMGTEKLKLSVGKLLGPVRHLMEAEQERLRSANSYVKRWIANERLVLEIAVPHELDEQSSKKETRDREALQTACLVLSRFTNCADGDIDTEKIRDEAFAIGHSLPKEEIDALCSARMRFATKLDALGLYIGPEVPLLINLCIAAYGKSEREFRMDTDTKTAVLNIMRILKARTDIDEYHTPTPPGTVAGRKVHRLSMPVFAAPEATASATSASTTAVSTTATMTSTSWASTTPRHVTPEKDAAPSNTTPPSKSPPPTPRRGSPDSGQNGTFSPASMPISASAGSATHGRNAGRGMNMGAAIAELKSRQTDEPGTDSAAKAQPDSAPVTPRGLSSASSGAGSVAGSSVSSTRSPRTPSSRKRLDEASRSDAIRQKSDGNDSSIQQPRRSKPAKRRVRSMESKSPDASDQKEMDMARKAARALKADLLKPLTDTVSYKKWEAAEQQLNDVMTPEMSKAVGRLMSYCHQVDLEHGREQASLDRVIKTLRPQVRETRAFVAVRDLLLAELRGDTSTKAAAAFPELLSLLVFAIDADRAWRQEHDAKASH